LYGFTEDEIIKFHNIISENVKKARTEKGLTQLDLALELGFKNSSFISHAENQNLNTHHYSLEHLYKISKVLDIELKDLL
jgi:transcriptional regulator with XRE-family HTH domain